MNKPLISIITPCYNAERYIEKYLRSINALSYKNIEVIVINDGSTDDTRHKLDEITSTNYSIKVIHTTNGGVSSARNIGLDVATGDWITFVDIDDIVPSDALDIMLEQTYFDCDIVFAGYQKICNDELVGSIISDKSNRMSALELAKELFIPSNKIYQGCICSKLYRRSIIQEKSIRFNERIKYNEDRLFTFTYLSHSKEGAYTTKPVYNYIQHGDNAMSAINGPSYWKFETDLDAFVEMNKIAPRFNSSEITCLVRLGTITSFHWNRRLNKEYGNNNKDTNIRLRKKLLSVVPRTFIYRTTSVKYYKGIKHKLYTLIKKLCHNIN